MTQYLPHKLAEFLANNYEGAIQVKKAGAEWSVLEYNKILWENVVPREKGTESTCIFTPFTSSKWSQICVRESCAPPPLLSQKQARKLEGYVPANVHC